jgi:predicted YcjX-like family ATPase
LQIADIADETRLAIANLADRAAGLTSPTLRLGVTGLARAGKTVFIAALVHNLVHGGRLPLFRAYAGGRLSDARLEPQPDDDVPRFDYERHLAALVDERIWPESTRQVSELRLTIEYESASFLSRTLGAGRLHLDIIDYPGEWLLDLGLLAKDYETWSRDAVAFARAHPAVAGPFLARLSDIAAGAPQDESVARELAALFTDYLRALRSDGHRIATQPPGRFLMPGDLEGSPALTFAPLDGMDGVHGRPGTITAMMQRRFEAYKSVIVRPFFRDYFARLDRQIVLVDVLQALNGGRSAVADLENALADVLSAFRLGRSNWLTGLVFRRVDRILFAATKADHLHHEDHDRLEAILGRLVANAAGRARFAGAAVEVLAIASVRATREAMVTRQGERLASIVGIPLPGETVDGRTLDGETEIAMFPGDLPTDPESIFQQPDTPAELPLRFVRFRPPRLERTAEGVTLSLPHIRLDRALEFLIGDRLT